MGQRVNKALECAKKIGKALVAMLVATIIYNPVVWVVWALISPTSAVGMMDEDANKTKPVWWFVTMFFVINVFILGYLLPWKVRQEVSKKIGFFYYKKDEVKAFDEGWHTAQYLSSKVRKIVWKRSNKDKEKLCEMKLSAEEFEEMLYTKNISIISTHLTKITPSKIRQKRLLDALGDGGVPGSAKKQIYAYIKRCGLPSDLALECTKDGAYSTIAMEVQQALAIYREVKEVEQLSSASEINWLSWLEAKNTISYEAQKAMNNWQLKAYCSKGYSLHEDLLLKYMRDEKKREAILSYVKYLKENGYLTDKAWILLTTEEWWRENMLEK